MKKYFLVCFLFVSSQIYSQTIKILFDASQAETAGSADWVVDANNYNIGYGSGPAVVGTGNEANAQQIPSPAQSGINGSTPETYWDGALSSWGIDLVNEGYTIETLPYNGQITYGNAGNLQDLSNYRVFIVCEPNIVFTATEKTAIMNFVQNGGGLFMVSDHDVSDRNGDGWDSPHIWNDLMTNNTVQNNPFGISFDYDNFSQTTSNIPALPGDSLLHGPYGNVTQVMFSNGTSMTLNPAQNSTVKGVVYKTSSSFGNSNVIAAYARFGSGRVAALGDSSPCDDGSGDPNDFLYTGWLVDAAGNHERLIMNMTIWLVGSISTAGLQNNVEESTDVKIYPNPFNHSANLQITSTQDLNSAIVYIYDVLGNEVKTIKNISQSHVLAADDFKPGVYFYQIFSLGLRLNAGKFVVSE